MRNLFLSTLASRQVRSNMFDVSSKIKKMILIDEENIVASFICIIEKIVGKILSREMFVTGHEWTKSGVHIGRVANIGNKKGWQQWVVKE